MQSRETPGPSTQLGHYHYHWTIFSLFLLSVLVHFWIPKTPNSLSVKMTNIGRMEIDRKPLRTAREQFLAIPGLIDWLDWLAYFLLCQHLCLAWTDPSKSIPGWKQQNYYPPPLQAVVGGRCWYIIDSSSMPAAQCVTVDTPWLWGYS